MDRIWCCLALLMLAWVSSSVPGHARDNAQEECGCMPGCESSKADRIRTVAGRSAASAVPTASVHHGFQFQDCSIRMGALPLVVPGIQAFVPRVRDTSLSEKILQYFDAMLDLEFALVAGGPNAPMH